MTAELSADLAQYMLELAPDATVVVDRDGAIVFANAQVERTFGYAPTELAAESVEILIPERFRSMHKEHRARFSLVPERRPMGGGLTLLGLHKAGSEFPVEISLSPVETVNELLVIAAVRDVTVRRDSERGLIEANREKSRLLAAASHDLRQPVQTLTLLNQTALRHAEASTKLREILERQQVALDTMAQLLASVLDISKLDSGAVKPVIADCSINDVLDRLRSDFGPQAEDKGLALVVEPTTEAGRTDPELLRRLLGNLISNAIRYTERGTVSVECKRAGAELVITVRDTGIGIPREELQRVFEEFYQAGHGPRRSEGLGLGLSIVRRLATLLDHEIGIDSNQDSGTAFTVRLPHAVLARALREAKARAKRNLRGRVLIVDDERPVAEATSLLLRVEGFDVDIASDRNEALAHSMAAAPDLIISDYHLRGAETGTDIVTELRARLGSDVPVIFVTGDTSRVARSAAQIPCTTLLSKPTQVDELLGAIQRHIASAADR